MKLPLIQDIIMSSYNMTSIFTAQSLTPNPSISSEIHANFGSSAWGLKGA